MGRRRTPLLAALAGLALAVTAPAGGGARAELWAGFYKPRQPVVSQDQAAAYQLGHDAVCLAAILEAQTRYDIPDNLLLSIGIQEAGKRGQRGLTVWPWAANAEGSGAFFPDRDSLLRWVRNQMAMGVESIDVGCMQVNQKWHGKAFASLEQAVDPRSNVDYAARYLRDLFRSEGDWWRAAGRYHSASERYKTVYLDKLARNQKIANANIDQFLALIVDQTSLAPIELAGVAPPQSPAQFWGKDSSGSGRGGFTIYSHSPMQPIIPDFEERN
ncbi:lytic transglycosylase domain-containing protein [Shimia sp.]|uniref:lytic transglycosylase domain-containing protein n=1 Tax=Shimia sp. TaxID=1954381 RepID=UPI0035669231